MSNLKKDRAIKMARSFDFSCIKMQKQRWVINQIISFRLIFPRSDLNESDISNMSNFSLFRNILTLNEFSLLPKFGTVHYGFKFKYWRFLLKVLLFFLQNLHISPLNYRCFFL